MVRTNAVTLTVIKAVAYRQKLPAGGSGIVILRDDSAQPGIASISKTSGEAIPAANTPKNLFPKEAFQEAITLTAGLPYKKQGVVMRKGAEKKEAPVEEPVPEEAVVDSDDYQKIVEAFTDKNGKLSYDLINKTMIRFAHASSKVRAMAAEGEKPAKLAAYVTGTKFRAITGNGDLTDAQIKKIVALLDEVSPKGVLKEFNDEIRKMLARK